MGLRIASGPITREQTIDVGEGGPVSSMADEATVVALVHAATVPRTGSDDPLPARFALELRPDQDPAAVGAAVEQVLADLRARVSPLSALDPEVLVLDLLDRALAAARPAACFAAGYALADRFDLVGAEPDLPTAFFPEQDRLRLSRSRGGALSGFPPGCWVDPEPALEPTPAWAIDRMHVPAAWAFSEQSGRPSRGEDVVVAQPDTGITPHVELVGVAFVPGFDVIDDDNDPTDPLTELGNPGHGTGTASVLVSLDSYVVTGSAPRARLMPIRTIESVVRIRQITVARAIDWAIQEGAHVVTMSLGGIPASALHRAISRAVEADMIVLAAAGNCVRLVVWPARYDECIAVAATNAADQPWPGTCRGAPVDISAPGQNVYRAVVPPRWPDRRRHRRPRAGHELRGRPHRRSRRTVGGSPRTSERGRRCTCPRRDGPGDVPAGCCSPRPADPPRGTRRRWVPGSSMRAHFSRRASTWALVARLRHRRPTRRRTPHRASRPWWRRPSAPTPVRRRAGLAPVRTGASHRGSSATAPGTTHRSSRAVSEPLARSISNPRLREWLGLRRLGV